MKVIRAKHVLNSSLYIAVLFQGDKDDYPAALPLWPNTKYLCRVYDERSTRLTERHFFGKELRDVREESTSPDEVLSPLKVVSDPDLNWGGATKDRGSAY